MNPAGNDRQWLNPKFHYHEEAPSSRSKMHQEYQPNTGNISYNCFLEKEMMICLIINRVRPKTNVKIFIYSSQGNLVLTESHRTNRSELMCQIRPTITLGFEHRKSFEWKIECNLTKTTE